MSRQESDHPEDRERPLRGLKKVRDKDTKPWAIRVLTPRRSWILYGRYKTAQQAQSAIDREMRRNENLRLFYLRTDNDLAATLYDRTYKIIYEGEDGKETE